MIRVAFWLECPSEYTGGLNYIRNLLYALSLADKKEIEPYVFLGTKVGEDVAAQLGPYAKIVRTRVLDRKSIPWFLYKIFAKYFSSLIVINRIMKEHGIAVVSHAQYFYCKHPGFRMIGWIPDFQYLHLPDYFPGLDSGAETARVRKLIASSDMVVLSSYDALNDFKRIAPEASVPRARVLHFVSQPSDRSQPDTYSPAMGEIEKKYGFTGKFFFLPNQFWAHKNHIVVFQAVKLLKEKGKDILVLCTGNLYDYRLKNTSYADSLSGFISVNGLGRNIKILGLIDYGEVLSLMRNSIAVLNPSCFEGWSSSVEEAKSFGKTIILSKINVHVEQNPPGGRYFDPDDPLELSRILSEVWDAPHSRDREELEAQALAGLRARTIDYAKRYVDLVHELS